MRRGTRRSREYALGVALVIAWSMAPPPAAAAATCDGVPFCEAQLQPIFRMNGWASATKSYTCKKPFPFVWGFTKQQTGSPSVSAIGEISAVRPGTMNILLTNWNPFQGDLVQIDLACSKSNSFGGDCGAPVGDPQCPVIPGSEKQYCSRGPVAVCFQTYQERCEPSNQLYSCTIDVLPIPYCQPCPG